MPMDLRALWARSGPARPVLGDTHDPTTREVSKSCLGPPPGALTRFARRYRATPKGRCVARFGARLPPCATGGEARCGHGCGGRWRSATGLRMAGGASARAPLASRPPPRPGRSTPESETNCTSAETVFLLARSLRPAHGRAQRSLPALAKTMAPGVRLNGAPAAGLGQPPCLHRLLRGSAQKLPRLRAHAAAGEQDSFLNSEPRFA